MNFPNNENNADVQSAAGQPFVTGKSAKKTSVLSKWSLRLAGITWLWFFLFIVLVIAIPPHYRPISKIFLIFFLIVFSILILAALSSAIAGIIHVLVSKYPIKGVARAIFAALLVLSLLSLILSANIEFNHAQKLMCQLRLNGLYHAIKNYCEENQNFFPPKDKWCDILLEQQLDHVSRFHCPCAPYSSQPSNENYSNYAINPDCEPNSPGDVVLLFDTKAGWNQHGGAELLAPENHQGKGCNVLFNDGTVKFVKKKHFNKLHWQ